MNFWKSFGSWHKSQVPHPGAERGHAPSAPGEQSSQRQRGQRVSIAIISNAPTPYRLHVLNRLARELDGISVHNVFTHTLSKTNLPWQMQIAPELNPVYFQQYHLTRRRPVSPRSYPLFRKIRQFVIDNDVRMLIVMGYNDLTRLALFRWAKRAGIPVILAGDSNIFGEGRLLWVLRVFKRAYMRWVLKHVSALMPMGTCGRAYFRFYKNHDLPEFLFPYEPDYSALARPEQKALDEFCHGKGLAPDRKRLLYCGRLIAVKRVDVLIDAFVRMAALRPEWDVVIAGEGPLRQQLESRVPSNLRDRIKWLGFLQVADTAMAYHACHVLVHPSEFEPWALVINEAVACNLPIISTAVVGASVELVRNRANGLIVSPRNVGAMTEAMIEITEPGRAEEMREHCREILEAWRKTADPIEGVRQASRHFGLIGEPGLPKPPCEPKGIENEAIA